MNCPHNRRGNPDGAEGEALKDRREIVEINYSLLNVVIGFVWFVVTIALCFLLSRELLGGKKARRTHLAGLFLLWAAVSIAGYKLMIASDQHQASRTERIPPGFGLATPDMRTEEIIKAAQAERASHPRSVCAQVLPSFVGGSCPSGWQTVIWNTVGTPHQSSPGSEVCADLSVWMRGAPISFSARCDGAYYEAWERDEARLFENVGLRVTVNGVDQSRMAEIGRDKLTHHVGPILHLP